RPFGAAPPGAGAARRGQLLVVALVVRARDRRRRGGVRRAPRDRERRRRDRVGDRGPSDPPLRRRGRGLARRRRRAAGGEDRDRACVAARLHAARGQARHVAPQSLGFARIVAEETRKERSNRELIELLNELRVALPGVQVLFAFMLTVPFANGFAKTTDFQRD